ncbi:MAG: WG repeat-containing protein [Haliscomenobacter sp.]|nr:WG repeat-containing protein [Haliscomenobacter sp.]
MYRVNVGGKADIRSGIIGGYWGLVDSLGNALLKPQYDAIESASKGLYRINVGGKPNDYGTIVEANGPGGRCRPCSDQAKIYQNRRTLPRQLRPHPSRLQSRPHHPQGEAPPPRLHTKIYFTGYHIFLLEQTAASASTLPIMAYCSPATTKKSATSKKKKTGSGSNKTANGAG